ncbi:MAG TPA: DNA-formamidopyrimidine glycosylase family protein [Thermoanaerobaculia bacterium]|nr:DNA-formamidopyrimidine glycosylase family protein [Thermoanaerobaculia bacterium]
MPELPDIALYLEALAARIAGQPLQKVRLASPFLLRTVVPPITAAEGRTVEAVSRLGKRVVWELQGDLFLVFHLMVAGRFHWKPPSAPLPKGKNTLAAFDFATGTVLLVETGSKKRASLKLLAGREALARENPGGLEPLAADLPAFRAALGRESHTLKRALTDPRLFSGIGNAYSDEILHRARLSPFKRTVDLSEEESARLWAATRDVLTAWTERLRRELKGSFPEKVTAFRPDFAVHGRYNQPCPDCGSPVQRILYAENESNYCATCQTGGRLLADRVLSQLLKADWPRTLEELEERKAILGAAEEGPG